MPILSILISTYNSSQYIQKTINSILSQTYQDWELIIVDDCSTDNTVSILAEYAKRDSRIRLLSTPSNSGSGTIPARLGAENAMGDYVSGIDYDDWIDNDFYSIMMPLAMQNPKSIITATGILFNSNGEIINQIPSFSSPTPQILSNHDAFILSLSNKIFGNASIISKELYLKITNRSCREVFMNTDEIDFRKMLLSVESVFVTKAKYHYRIHANSITHQITPNYFERLITNVDLYKLAKRHIEESNPEIIKELKEDGWRTFISHRILFLKSRNNLTKQECKRIRKIIRKAWILSKKNQFFSSETSIKQRIITSTYPCFLLYSLIKYHLEKKHY